MNEDSSSTGGPSMNSPETNENEDSEMRALTQEEIDEQIKSFIAPLTRQLEDLTRLVSGMTIASHLDYYERAGTSASYSAPGDQPDIFIPDTFKHVRWQNTFNGYKVHQISPRSLDYACFLVKCINYQNVTQLCNVCAQGA